MPSRVIKDIRIEPRARLEPPTGARNRKKNTPINLLSIILDPALNQEEHLIPNVDQYCL